MKNRRRKRAELSEEPTREGKLRNMVRTDGGRNEEFNEEPVMEKM